MTKKLVRYQILSDIDQGKPVDPAPLKQATEEARLEAEFLLGRRRLRIALDVLWILFLFQRESGDTKAACNTLESLFDSVETLRAKTTDVQKRAGFIAAFPNLYSELCRWQFSLGRYEAAFRTIEGSKGRTLGDVLTSDNDECAGLSFAECRDLLAEHSPRGTHYLTGLSGSRTVYLLLVDSNLDLHHYEIPLSKLLESLPESTQITPAWPGLSEQERLGYLISSGRQRRWQVTRPNLFTSAIDYAGVLSPIVSWLNQYLEEGDHVVFCPDADLYNLPLHLLSFEQSRLGDYVTVSRIQGLQTLAVTLRGESTPSRAISFTVPSSEDTWTMGKKEKEQKLQAMYAVADHLDTIDIPHVGFRGTEADSSGLVKTPLERSILHFSAHGNPPTDTVIESDTGKASYTSPLKTAGLLLSHKDRLPGFKDFDDDAYPGRLSPSVILGLPNSLKGAQINMMACVSGLVKEGAGGDALGLEYAFAQKGCMGIVSAYWDVSATAASAFFKRFYTYWLEGCMTRAKACQLAAHTVDEEDRLDAGAFFVSGDWR